MTISLFSRNKEGKIRPAKIPIGMYVNPFFILGEKKSLGTLSNARRVTYVTSAMHINNNKVSVTPIFF
jgi:hypothetical protein